MYAILADISESATQANIQTAASLGTVVMSLAATVFTYLTNRDRLKFDFEKNDLKQKNTQNESAISQLKIDMKSVQKERDNLAAKLDMERRDRELQAKEFNRQLVELRDRRA